MRGCELLFTPEVAEKVHRTISEQLGGVCPCDVGRRCPLLPDDITDLLPRREDEDDPRLVPVGPRRPIEDAPLNEAANRSLGLRLRLIAEEARQSDCA
jgi:hypothetical protein